MLKSSQNACGHKMFVHTDPERDEVTIQKQESEFARLEQDTPVLSSFFFDAHLR